MPRRPRPLPPELVIERDGRVLLFDQSLERNLIDFSKQNIDYAYILDLAEQSQFTGVVLSKDVAANYFKPGLYTVPLVVKLNGWVDQSAEYAPLDCTVAEAVNAGAKAVGYELYLGHVNESKMMADLSSIVRDAHERRLPVIVWVHITSTRADQQNRDLLAYAGRVVMELGADYVELPYGGNSSDYAWVVDSTGKTKVITPVSFSQNVDDGVAMARAALQAGSVGLAVGPGIWQSKDPLAAAKTIRTAVWRAGGRPSVSL